MDMKKSCMRIITIGMVLAMSLLIICGCLIPVQAAKKNARPSINGALHVDGTQLVDEHDQPVVLKGVSTHGLQWFPDYVNESLFQDLSANWDCNLVRMVMYASHYASQKRAYNMKLMRQGIDAALSADQYVLVDWHIMPDEHPMDYLQEAKSFFKSILEAYPNAPNLLFEVCNEPAGSWRKISAYANEIIPYIRKLKKDAVIIVGTPDYDKELLDALDQPLSYDNLMYSCHFYAATDGRSLRSQLDTAISKGLPVFVTECGLSEATGDGKVDFKSAVQWFDDLNQHKLSYAIWSLSNKPESSALIRSTSTATQKLTDDDLTSVGLWVKALISGSDPASIPVIDTKQDKNGKWMLSLGERGLSSVKKWYLMALCSLIALLLFSGLIGYLQHASAKKYKVYDDLIRDGARAKVPFRVKAASLIIMLSSLFTLIYLIWRVMYSVPTKSGLIAIAGNLILLAVEILGFIESVIHYHNMAHMREHPLPHIEDDEYPDVDIFIATYNEPVSLLRKTIIGCKHLRYPDKSKVHIWVCDDNRRPAMRQLAEEHGVGYFDRPDNKGAKAGNLNAALARTSAPYVVTLDADMIVKSDFLLKTVPYFVDAQKRNDLRPEGDKIPLGLLQTPQCFYDPDVFQHALYSEKRAPNEQDFFYRTIEVAKTSTNSVIYGGSNTMIARQALEDIGGFYTESITEDFATGLLIESAGYVSLGLGEPLASGQTPHTFKEHIQQRTRWGRGVIVTAKKLHLFTRKGLSFMQRINYWSSEVYWYSPIKNIIYMLSPLLYAVFNVPVFYCNWLELLVFWFPMFLFQDLCLRFISGNRVSSKWSGIYEASVMPHLFIPIIKEALGITLSAFKVTDKSGVSKYRQRDLRSMIPFIVLSVLSVLGIMRILYLLSRHLELGLFILLFWTIRNFYYLIMAIFLVDGRDSDGEAVKVIDTELVQVTTPDQKIFEGVTTLMTEHSVSVYLDESEGLKIGDSVSLNIESDQYDATVRGIVIGINYSRSGSRSVHTIEILDFGSDAEAYQQILFDRIPTLPQSLTRDFGILPHLWINIAHRVARSAH